MVFAKRRVESLTASVLHTATPRLENSWNADAITRGTSWRLIPSRHQPLDIQGRGQAGKRIRQLTALLQTTKHSTSGSLQSSSAA